MLMEKEWRLSEKRRLVSKSQFVAFSTIIGAISSFEMRVINGCDCEIEPNGLGNSNFAIVLITKLLLYQSSIQLLSTRIYIVTISTALSSGDAGTFWTPVDWVASAWTATGFSISAR